MVFPDAFLNTPIGKDSGSLTMEFVVFPLSDILVAMGVSEGSLTIPSAVFVLPAAMDSLDHERAARQPLGLFGRLRAEREAEQAGAAAAEASSGWRGWVGSMLRFHGRG